MADININFGESSFEKEKKELLEMLEIVKKIRKERQDTGIITDNEEITQKKILAQSLKLSNEIEKQQRIKAKSDAQIKIEANSVTDLTNRYKLLEKQIKATANPSNSQIQNLKQIETQLDAAKKSTNDWGTALGSFQFKFNALGNIAANVFSRITTYTKQFISDSIKMAAQTEGVRTAFDRLNKPGLLDNLRKATRGAVTDLSLMKAAVLAENFKIPLDQLATFLKFAGNQALRTGQDFDYLVESIIRGLGRESVLVLDNLGLSAKELQDEAKKTGSFFEGAAKVIQQEMTKAGEVVNTNATTIARLNATLDNTKVKLGEWLLTNSNVLKGLANFNDLSESELSTWKKLNIAFDETPERMDAILKSIENFKNAIDEESAGGPLEPSLKIIDPKTIVEDGADAEKALQDLTDSLLSILIDYGKDQDKETDANLEARKKQRQKRKEDELKDEKELADDLIDFRKETDQILFDLGKDQEEKADEDFIKSLEKRTESELRIESDKEKAKQDILRQSFENAFQFTNLLAERNRSAMELELAQAGLSEEQKLQIRRKYAKKEQNIAIAEAAIGAAQAVVAVWARWAANPIVAGVLTGLALSATGIQIATIKAQKFHKGGEIKGQADEVPIIGQKGEFVVKKSAYQKNKELVNAINAEDSYKIALAMRQDKGQVKQEKNYTKELYEWMKKQPSFGESPEFYIRVENGVEYRLNKIPK